MARPEQQSQPTGPKVTYEEKMVAGIAHVGVFFAVSGLVANVIIYLVYRARSPFLAAHSRQALLWQGLTLLLKVLSGLAVAGVGGAVVFSGMTIKEPWLWLTGAEPVPPVLVGLAALLWVLYFTSVLALKQAWGGRPYRYPVVGRFID